GGERIDQPRLQEDVQGVGVTAPAPPGRAAGRHHQDRSGARWIDAVDAVTVQLELPGHTEEEDERVVRQGRLESLIGGLLTVAERLQAPPPPPLAGRQSLAGEMLDEFERPVQAAESRFSLSHDFSPPSCVRAT